MSQEQNKPENQKKRPESDGVAQQPGLHSESSGTSGTTGRNEGEPPTSSGAMEGQGTFGSGKNGPGMGQSGEKSPPPLGTGAEAKGKALLKERSEKVDKLKKGLRDDEHFDSAGDPETARDGMI